MMHVVGTKTGSLHTLIHMQCIQSVLTSAKAVFWLHATRPTKHTSAAAACPCTIQIVQTLTMVVLGTVGANTTTTTQTLAVSLSQHTLDLVLHSIPQNRVWPCQCS